MNPVAQAAVLVTFPVLATVVGSLLASFAKPSATVTSGVQHLAAGVVLAAVATEVLPGLRREGHLLIAAGGFVVAVALLLALNALERHLEARTTQRGARVFPVGLIVLVAVDLLIDGLLVGLGSTLKGNQALILTVALTLEVVFLALSVATELAGRGFARRITIGVPSLLGLAIAAGAIGGAATLSGASTAVLAGVLAFGAAALLFLVTEELLVEAHETEDTPLLTAVFFAGFLGVYLLGG